MSLLLVTPPATEPVSLSEAKDHCEIGASDTAHDTKLTRFIKASREDVERITRRALITQTWKRTLSGFPPGRKILLPRPPLQSVSITYYDGDGVSQSLSPSAIQVDTVAAPGSVQPAVDFEWPVTQSLRQIAVEIEFVAGFGNSSSDVPSVFRQLILELVAFRFWSRGDLNLDIPKHIQWSLQSLRCGAHSDLYEIKS